MPTSQSPPIALLGDDGKTMPYSEKLRRPGYTPGNAALGRRGAHTRDRIVACAAELFVANGYNGTSIDAIAKAVGGSRATIYQYFESKQRIFLELVGQCEQAVLEHGRRLGRLGPDAEGWENLQRWLREWGELYDRYAMVFLEFPGIGTIEGLPHADTGKVAGEYERLVVDKLRAAGLSGIEPGDAAAALLRISHMVNLYRYRGMFELPSREQTSASLAVAMQLMLFPDTPASVIGPGPTPATPSDEVRMLHTADVPETPEASPISQDILSASSVLFAERGYYAVAMEDIATASNISRATLYRYFGNKLKILAELSNWATIEGDHLAAELREMASGDLDVDALRGWMGRYVRFHRSYGGIIRASFDGTLAEQLSEDRVSHGMDAFDAAATSVLNRLVLPVGIDAAVAAAVFLAVLGRMTEPTASDAGVGNDYDTAERLVLIVRRALLPFAA
ncbi:MAG: transcriptional regulator, TetR family [Mycobacterium sp.]|nr:transcriptional regulator, TetR family [Mycobacterium sp.]